MRFVPLIAACALAACSSPGGDGAGEAAVNVDAIDSAGDAASAGANVAEQDAPAPGTQGVANISTPGGEVPFSDESAQGAAKVVETYFALIEEKRLRDARALWEGTPNMDSDVMLAETAEFHVQVGKPGAIEAGAGQRYVKVPIVTYGRLKAGNQAFNRKRIVTLHRTADIEGATAVQKGWRIRSID